ncbi:bifunctional 4-hydroxy-4-methyl-2-oxoglutarate aldolase/oxaloacetate decarboxylase SCDLUD_005171 [Saccharomycodes ludwigii]|uniref:bifunctional 4-hydroxy-4-methyl-2-oxoglutarate aldolase/oxaloacetate decarboxylase n=1 Tax=Saccharomycodes ludwigii TaxID=36035 RepID=UPI001E859C62|nr:hypothetical protein SCDLUD_005171 [Saccharomycodes ludwigii]KAH3898833.1 hypothetical protein SCDLUD_005171 [Saccharomycodes ludwigii]
MFGNTENNDIQVLNRFTTCDIADGLLNTQCKLKDGGFFPNLQQWSKSKKYNTKSVAGKAYTVLFATKDDPRPSINYIDTVPDDSILIIGMILDLQTIHSPYTTYTQAMYGGLMSTRAQYLGANGTVVFGRIRDVEEHRELGHPVWSYALGSCAPKEVLKPVAVEVDLEILKSDNSIGIIKNGDYVICDEHGMASIPSSYDLNHLIRYIDKSIEADNLVSQDIKEGKPAKQAQKERRAVLEKYR